MTDGLNKSFMDDPDSFLRDHPVDINPYNGSGMDGGQNVLARSIDDNQHLPEGVTTFDLELDNASGLVRLRHFADRDKAEGKYTHRIVAYWLPWNPRGVASVTFDALNNSGARFLFTSSLAGCRILMTDTGFHHISGQLTQRKRVKISDGLREGGRARAFSQTTGNKYGNEGESDTANEAGAFIVGYRAQTGRRRQRNGEWNFAAQRASKQPRSPYTVDRIWLNNDLFEIDVDV